METSDRDEPEMKTAEETTRDSWTDVAGGLNELEAIVSVTESLDDTLSRIALTAQELASPCDAAGVFLGDGMIAHDDLGVRRSVASDGFALQIDEFQIELDEGPCLEAMRTGKVVSVDDVDSDERFPEFVERAAAVGLLASHSVPLIVEDATVGSLNLYARTKRFDEPDKRIGEAMAAQAALALANAVRLHNAASVIEGLRSAIETRDVIGQAKGILMERLGVAEDLAFDHLVALSQRANVKLRDLAAVIAEQVREPRTEPGS